MSFVLFVITSLFALAVPESQYTEAQPKTIDPYFLSVELQTHLAPDGTRLAYRFFPVKKSRGTIVIVHGFTEFSEKYAETVFDLKDSGYNVLLYDQRGHGHSARALPDSLKGHVEHFQDYIDDLSELINRVVKANGETNIFLLGHSMGGAVSTALAIQKPDLVRAVVVSSPMYKINLGFFEGVGLIYAELASSLGFGNSYTIGRGPNDYKIKFAGNWLTSSQIRFDHFQRTREQNRELIVSGPTNSWLREAILLSRYDRDHAAQLRTPILVLEGSEDHIVSTAAEEEFAAHVPNGKIVKLDGAKHEIFIESDNYRNLAIEYTRQFFDSQDFNKQTTN